MTQPRDRRMRLGLVIASTREGRFGPTVAQRFAEQVENADAIDLARQEWIAKPIAFVSYGGMARGLRAVEHLRPVFAELHATTVRFHNAHSSFDTSGQPLDERGSQEAAARMLRQLSWWAGALLVARETMPYPAAGM